MTDPLLFTPPVSSFEPAFWETLYNKKLNVYRLNADPVSIIASVTNSDGKEGGHVKFSDKSFNIESGRRVQSINGLLINVNKIEVSIVLLFTLFRDITCLKNILT